MLVNDEQIERIDFLGLVDDEEKQFKIKLNELISKAFNVENNTDEVETFNV